MKERTGVGVLGLGLMGRRMLGSLARHADFEVRVGFDVDRGRGADVAKEFGFEWAESVEELLGSEDLDLVYVATPPASHVELGRMVLESGRALFLEKPLAVDLEASRELVEMAKACGLPAAMNFPLATLPGFRAFEHEVRSGDCGKALRIEVELHFSCWPRSWHKAGPWLAGDREGGFSREVFSHFAYLSQRMVGPLELVHSRVIQNGDQGESRVFAEFCAGETPVTLVGGVGGAAPDFNRWTLFTEKRSYRVEDWSIVSRSDGGPWTEVGPGPGESRDAQSQLDELASLLRGEDSCLPSLRDGWNVMRAVEEMLSAGRRS